MIEIALVNLDDILEKSKFEQLLSFVSAEKRERIGGFYKYEDALRTLIGDVLARYLLCRRLKVRNQMLEFGVNQYGKPYLTNYTDVEFNISHSGKWVACTVDNLPVGIDVEQIKPVSMDFAERIFSKEEFGCLAAKSIDEQEAYFYTLWVLKESYIKAIGKGLSMPLNSFTIRIGDETISVNPAYASGIYYFKQYPIGGDYRMAVCSRKNEFPRDLDSINIHELYEAVLSIL
ncbi:MAG TPA: 4'-phosphopantetheinyl transferase superfamily protein [Clostridia bacterium]|nr:4'-phosphopantetheinyl transferase superfamily protein [Clostridia bacterium]